MLVFRYATEICNECWICGIAGKFVVRNTGDISLTVPCTVLIK